MKYDRATGSAADLRLTDLIAGDAPLAVTEPVIMEVLAGARTDDREVDLRRLLLRFDLLRIDAVADFHAAAHLPSLQECRRHAQGTDRLHDRVRRRSARSRPPRS